MMIFNTIEIAQYGIARSILALNHRAIPRLASMTIKTKDTPGDSRMKIRGCFTLRMCRIPKTDRDIRPGKIARYQRSWLAVLLHGPPP
jgi:hypothetical protein